MSSRILFTRRWWPLLILLFASALAYLPLINQIRFSNDDWYLVHGAHVRGPDYFTPAYERDRPMRAFVLAPEYALFGDNPLPYHLTMYAFRLLGAVTFFWLLNQLWPPAHRNQGTSNPSNSQISIPNLIAAILFLLYPGFLSQPNPLDYQSQIIALFAVIASLACTVAALQAEKPSLKILYTVLSFLLAWIYLGLIEYYIGLEVLRLLCVFLVMSRQVHRDTSTQGHAQPLLPNSQFLTRVFFSWLPFLLGPLTFLVWRLFFFTSERHATDAGLQLGLLFSSPATGLWWLARFVQDALNVLFLAWGVPLYHLAFNLRLSQTWIGMALAAATAGGVIIALRSTRQPGAEEEAQNVWRAEMLWVGIVSALAGLIPVILVNRHVEFFSFSRYTLASSIGAAMAVTALLEALSSARLRMTLFGLLVTVSVMTHFANGAHYAADSEAMRDFWWQVSWRVPQMKDGVTLAAIFPASVQEDYFLWGAANLIYHPEAQEVDPVEARISGVVLTPENVTRILAGKGVDEPDRRGTHVTMDYGNILLLAQTGPGGCVRVLDGAQPELSASDDARVMLLAVRSNLANVDLTGSHPAPSVSIFGPEPEHGWCWYYQQAALARQRGEWERVAALGDEALQLGHYPVERVEWFPFLQAYAVLGREKDLKKLAPILGADPFLQGQACAILKDMAHKGTLLPEIQTTALGWYCH